MGLEVNKILVTGGTGFTGYHLVKRLLMRGHQVVVVDNQEGRFFQDLEKSGAKISIGSVTDKELMDRLVQGCDLVFHLAAAFREINVSKQLYWDVNVNGTRYLLDAALKHGVSRFVYCSTQGVHGHIAHPPGDESSPIAPADYYQYTKYKGEEVVQEFMQRGLKATVIRPTAIYGPGDPGRWAMLFKRVAPGRFLMFGDGETTYHPVYIDNLVDAFELAGERDQAIGQTYIIGDQSFYTLNELVNKVADVLGVEAKIIHLPFWPLWLASFVVEMICIPLRITPPLFRRRVDWFRQYRGFSIEKAKKELGYQPKIGIEEGLMRTAKWYIEVGIITANLPPSTGKSPLSQG